MERPPIIQALALGAVLAGLHCSPTPDAPPPPDASVPDAPGPDALEPDASPATCPSLLDGGTCVSTPDAGARPVPDGQSCARSFGDRGDDTVTSLFVDPSGNIVVTGRVEGSVDFGGGTLAGAPLNRAQNVFVAKYDSACNHLWSRRFDSGTAVIDRQGGVFVRGPSTSVWLDSSGSTVLTLPSTALAPNLVAVDPTGGIATAVPDSWTPQGGGGGGVLVPGYVTRLNPMGQVVWKRPRGGNMVAIDHLGNVFVPSYEGTASVIAKLDAQTGTNVWCVPAPANLISMSVARDDDLVLVTTTGSSVGVLELAPSGCTVVQRSLSLPSPMRLRAHYVDTFLSPFGASGTVAVTPWGDVHVATVDSKLRLASFAPDGSLIGLGVYGRAGAGIPEGHPAPAIAVGPSGDVVLGGGFSSVDLDLGAAPLPNTFDWSTDLFFARNPPYADRSSAPPAPSPPATVTPVRAASTFGVAVSSTNVYWLEFPSPTQADLYECASSGCGAGEPKKLASLPSLVAGLAANASGVFAAAGSQSGGVLLRCPGNVCVADTLPFAPIAFALGTSSFAFAAWGLDYFHLNLLACPLGGCGGAPTVLTSNFAVSYAADFGLAPGFGSTSMGLESCPVTGCGTSPPAGTDWVTLLPNLDLATDSANVHVLGGGHVDSCTLPGCTPSSRLTAAGLGDVRYASTFAVTPRIATDGVSVYFFDYGPSAPWVPATGVRLSKCPVAGCPVTGPEVLWTSPAWPSTPAQRPLALAVDGANVFFTAMQPDLTSWLVKMPK